MKKAITTILSALLLISCLTVNVFAEEAMTDFINFEKGTLVNQNQDEQGIYNWDYCISLDTFYSDEPLTATIKCNSETEFHQYMNDDTEVFNFHRDESTITVNIPKNETTFLCLGDDNNTTIHAVNTFVDYNEIFQNSFLNYVNCENDIEFSLYDSDYNSDKKFFQTLTLCLFVGDEDYQLVLNTINYGSDISTLEDNVYSIDIKYDSLVSKDAGIDSIDGYDVPFVQYQISYNGETENVILYFSNTEENPSTNESAITEAVLSFGDKEVEMFQSFYGDNNVYAWSIYLGEDDKDTNDYYWNYINSSSDPHFEVKYKTLGSEKTDIIDNFSIGVADDLGFFSRYAFYYDEVTQQKHYFYLEPTTPAIDTSSLDNILLLVGETTYTIAKQDYQIINGRKFYKPNDLIAFNNGLMCEFQFISNNHTVMSKSDNLRIENLDYGSLQITFQGIKFYDIKDNSFVYICTNYIVDDPQTDSFIKPLDNNISYNCMKQDNNRYFWDFNIGVEDFYNGNIVLVMNNNTEDSINISQASESINNCGEVDISLNNNGFSFKPVIGNSLIFDIEKRSGETQEHQTHIFNFNFNQYDILDKSLIDNINVQKNFYYLDTHNSIFDVNKFMFDMISCNIILSADKYNSLISKIQAGVNVDFSQYYNIALKEGCSFNGNPSVEIKNSSYGKMAVITYEITNGTFSEIFTLYIQRETNDNDGSKLLIDGKEFYREKYNNIDIYLPVSHNAILDFDLGEIVNAVNSENDYHNTIIVDYDVSYIQDNQNKSYAYADGYELEESVNIYLRLYYLKNEQQLNSNNISFDDLEPIEKFKNYINTNFLLTTFDNYEGAAVHRLKTEIKIPYKNNADSAGTLLYPSLTELSPAPNESVSIWISCDDTSNQEEIYFYRNMRFAKPASLTFYNFSHKDNAIFDYNRTSLVGGEGNNEYPATAAGLEKAVNNLRNSGTSSVILMSDITLERDVYLYHNNSYSNNPETNSKADLEINLNGHKIDLNNHSIINLRNSAIHLTNYEVKEGKSSEILNGTVAEISGSGNEPAIVNYGNLYVFDKVDIKNPNGTGLLSYNSGGVSFAEHTNINAKVCIDLQENEIMADGRESSYVHITGNLIASEVAINNVTMDSEIKTVISLNNRIQGTENGSGTHKSITSQNIGIRSVGNVDIEIFGLDILASQPFVIGGGTLEIRNTNVTSQNFQNSGNVTLGSNPVILIDSNREYATKTSILIAAENNVNMKTAGTLIKEVASESSKIDKIYFYSINSRDFSFFDYSRLFEFEKPVTAAYIHLNGGCFKDRSFENYLLNSPKSIVEYTDENNERYYYNNKNCFREVDNFDDLKGALENQDVQDIKLTGNIVASRNDTTVTFEVNGPKVLFLNGHTIENVHFVANTTKFNSPKAFFSIQNSNDSNSNIAAGKLLNTGTVLETKTTNLYINDVDVESTDDIAIKIYGGRASIRGKNNKISITGTNAIMLDNTASNMNMGNLDIEYSNVIGTSGPAINVVKTNATTYIHIFNQSLVKSDYLNQNDLNNSSAIKISDRAKVMMENSEISGKKYGIYFADGLSAQGFVNYYAGVSFGKGSVLKGDIALRLGDYTTTFMNDATIIATSKVMEIHGFTQYMIGSGDYKVTDKNGKIIDFVGSNSSAHTHWHVITGGYYSHCVEDNAIFNSPASNYLYKCMPVDTTDNKNPEPWKVVIKEKNLKNYQSLEVPSERDVIIDNTRLENAFDKNELPDGVSYDVVLTVKFKNDTETKNKFDGHENGFKEYYDIHVDKSLNNVVITDVDETKNYQLISIPLNNFKYENDDISYSDVNNIKVHHNHKEGNNSVTYQLKKITKNQAKNAKEECYYLDNVNGQWYLNIITRRFSDFAIQDTRESVVTQELKPDYTLTLNYQELYSSVNQVPPDTATYNGTNSISKEKVDIVYYNINGSEHYYSSEFPTKTGEYAVEWTVKESEDFTGKGVAQFKVLDVDLNDIQIKQDLVFTGKPQQLIEDITNIDNYSFVVEDYRGNKSKFEGVAPTMTNAGKYKVYFSKNGYVEYKGEAEISKANPVAPEKLYGTYGNRLSTVSLEDFSGWKWEKPNLFISNVGTLYYWASFKETDNYNSARVNVLVEVSKKQAPNPQLPKVENVVYGTTLGDIRLTGTWKWKDETIVPDVKNNGYQAYIIVDDTRFDWSKHTQYNPEDHSYVVTLKPNVSKADITLDKSSIPTFYNVKKGTLLSELEFASSSGWSWVNPKDAVGDSNYAVYNPDPDRNNYNDLFVSIPVYIKETVAGKEVSISNTVSSSDEKGIEEVTISNDGISKSVIDAVANTSKSDTKVTGEAAELINKAGTNSSLSISTEFVKETVNDETKKQEAIEKANVKSDEVAMVLDLEIKITVNDGTATKPGKITELAEPVELTFKLPEGSKTTAAEGKELKYYVLVIHGDDVLKIPATLNAADGTVTFSADKFSTYILVSEEVTKTVVENSTPSYVPSANKKPVVNTAAK